MMSFYVWCLIPEILGSQMEAISAITHELEISTDYLGSGLEM
jgi:hypothetical protein